MRIIKFRGLRTDSKGWVYGDLLRENDNRFGGQFFKIFVDTEDPTEEGELIMVDGSTIGQFTGLHDKNGKEIYDDDIIKWGMHKGSEEYFHRYAVVEFNPDIQFRILFYVNSETGEKKPTDNYIFHFGKFAYSETDKHIEIIGNVFENADFVKF